MNSKDYWRDRDKAEREWQKSMLKADGRFNDQLKRYYNRAIADINKDIDAQFTSLAKRDGTTIQEAKRAVEQADITDYEQEAQKLVEEARLLRAQGKKVHYSDYSEEVNQRMRLYNATMRVNRLELLKSKVGLRMVEAGIHIDQDMQDKLSKDYISELKRQAGILSMTADSNQLWTSEKVAKQVMAQTSGPTFSDRIWANQDALKARLDEVLATGILKGKNPREMAKELKDLVRQTVTNHSYVTERIARTESARVQFKAQQESIKEAGYDYCKWIAEPSACKACTKIAGLDTTGEGAGVYKVGKVPQIPVHPNCRCSIGAFWVEPDQAPEGAKKAEKYKASEIIKEAEQKEFDKLMQQELAKLTEEEIRRIGREVYPKLAKQGITNGKKFSQLGANFAKFNEDYRRRKFASYADYREAWDENVKAIQEVSNAQAEMVADVIKEYREVGSVDLKFQPRSSVPLRKLIKIAYDHYPTDWSREAEARNTLKVRQVGRGYYDDRNATIAADKNNWSAQTTMYHELGHRQESVNKEIVRLENEFYERRTEGEREQKLSVLTGNSNYASYETAKPDNFKSVYMGKRYIDYSTQEPSNFELLSTGLEGIYQARYNIWEDQDMAEFILGLLLKG